jgi:hypothetical protein
MCSRTHGEKKVEQLILAESMSPAPKRRMVQKNQLAPLTDAKRSHHVQSSLHL